MPWQYWTAPKNGAQAEPLYLDVMTALAEAFNRGERETLPRVIGGRYGLSSKEFGPECVLAVFAELREAKPKPRFTVGIYDDVTNLSLPCRKTPCPRMRNWKRCSTVWAATAASRRPRTTSKLSATLRRGMRKDISSTTPKSGRTYRLPPARQRTPDPLGIPDFSGGFCWLSPAPVH